MTTIFEGREKLSLMNDGAFMDNAKGFRLLIVDNNLQDRKNYVRLLRKNSTSDFRFLEAETCAAGLDLCQKFVPDCIITEYDLPDQTGIVFVDKLKHQLNLQIPVIMVTGEGEEEVAVLAIKNGVQDYLTKESINHENLLFAIENAVEKQDLQSQIEAQQQEILEKNKELTEKNEALRCFAHTVAHDIRDPLGSMMTALEFIVTRNEDMPETHKVMMSECIKTLQRVLALVKDILSFSKGISNSESTENFEMAEIFDDIISDLEPLICEKNAIINISSLPNVHFNRNNLYRIFLNLVKNALKYSRKTIPPQITINCFDCDDFNETDENSFRYNIVVKDNGIGFSDAFKDSIFSPFKRVYHDSDVEGSGIGLASVKSLLDHYKCKIEANGSSGKGAKFTISLPLNNLGDNSELEEHFKQLAKQVTCIEHEKSKHKYAFIVTKQTKKQIHGYHSGTFHIHCNDIILYQEKRYTAKSVKPLANGNMQVILESISKAQTGKLSCKLE